MKDAHPTGAQVKRSEAIDSMHRTALLFLLASLLIPIGVGELLDPNKIDWRLVNIVTVITGGIGFFSVSGEAARVIPKNTLPYDEAKARTQLRHLKWIAPSYRHLFQGNLPRYSDHDQPEPNASEQMRAAEQWAETVLLAIHNLDEDTLGELTLSSVGKLPDQVTHPFLRSNADDLLQGIQDYADTRNTFLATQAALERGAIEEAVVFFGPFFAAMAIGLAWLKALYGPV